MTLKVRSGRGFWAILALAFLVRATFFLKSGVVPAGDTEVWDPVAQDWARSSFGSFIQSDALFLRFLDFRLAYPFFLAVVYVLFGVGNHAAVVWVQLLLDSLIAGGLYWTLARQGRTAAGLLAGLLYAFLWESFRWTTYILTDALFTFELVVLFLLAISVVWRYRLWKAAALGALILGIQLTRGNAILLLGALPFFLAGRLRSRPRDAALLLAVSLGITAILFSPFAYKFSTLPQEVKFQERGNQMKRRSLNEVLLFSTRVIQDGKIESELRHGETRFADYLRKHPLHYLKIAFLKLVVLYNPVADNFSWKHNLLNLLYLVPIYGFALVGLRRARDNPVCALAALFVACLTVLQMLTWVDYDQRYRAPIMPFLVLLAAEGIVRAMARWRGGEAGWGRDALRAGPGTSP